MIKNDKEPLLLNDPPHAEEYLKSSTTILKRSSKSEIMMCMWEYISWFNISQFQAESIEKI